MKFVFENNKNSAEFKAAQPKKYAKAEIRYMAKAETIRRNEIRKDKRMTW